MEDKKKYIYLLFNKPYEVLCQFTDEMGRKTLKDFIPIPGIYPVGRLDYDSEGLLFLTNDTELNHKISAPRFKQPKIYWAQVEGLATAQMISKLKRGVVIGGRKTRPAKVKILLDPPEVWERSKPIRFRKTIPTSWLEILIYEGQYHQIRRMTAAVGLPCLRLIRVSIGPLGIRSIKPGEYVVIKKPNLTY